MKKPTAPRPSRLVPQSVAKKRATSWRKGAPRPVRNIYRRSRKGERRKFWRPAVFLTLGLVALAGLTLGFMLLYHHLLTSPYFCIKEDRSIEIVGLKKLTPELILKMAGLGPGTNLLALKPGRVEQALLAHPWIAKAELTRKWPQSLHLRIQEREPVALVQMGELYYVDRQGRLFKPLSPGDPHDFPVITGLRQEHFHQGDGGLPEVLSQVFQLLDLLKTTPPPLNLENISEVHVDLERGLTLYANGLPAALDLGLTDFAEKLKKFAQIWPALTQKGYAGRVGRINLDYPQRVLITLNGVDEAK
jgi:cell division protein FtsQ